MNIKQIHNDLLTALNTMSDNTSLTAYTWLSIPAVKDWPRFMVEPPSVVEAPDVSPLTEAARVLRWSAYYVNRYTGGLIDTNPAVHILGKLEEVIQYFDQNARRWTTSSELLYTDITVYQDNIVNSWARDLQQPYVAVLFSVTGYFL